MEMRPRYLTFPHILFLRGEDTQDFVPASQNDPIWPLALVLGYKSNAGLQEQNVSRLTINIMMTFSWCFASCDTFEQIFVNVVAGVGGAAV